MVKTARQRTKKYSANIDSNVTKIYLDKQKDAMIESEGIYFAEITEIEKRIKNKLEKEGFQPYLIVSYLNFGREMYSLSKKFKNLTLSNEAQNRVNKWVSRGLRGDILVEIAKMFSVNPTAPPISEIENLADLHDVAIVSVVNGELLIWDSTTLKWKNKVYVETDPSIDATLKGVNLSTVRNHAPNTHGNSVHDPAFISAETDPSVDATLKNVTISTVRNHAPNSHVHPTSDINSGTFGNARLDLTAIAQNIVFEGAQTVDGRDISADLNQAVKTTSAPTFAGLIITGNPLINGIARFGVSAGNDFWNLFKNPYGLIIQPELIGMGNIFLKDHNANTMIALNPYTGGAKFEGTLQAAGYKSNDGSSGLTQNVTIGTIVLHFKNGLLVEVT